MSAQDFNPYVLAFVCLDFAPSDTRVLNSLEELWITRVAAVNFFTRVLSPWKGSMYIIIHRQTVSLYHNSSLWLDMQDASNWDWNLPNFTLDMVIIIIITKLGWLHGFPWLSLTIYPYQPLLLVGPQDCTSWLHRANECKFLLIGQHCCVHVLEFTGEHCFRVCPCRFSSNQYV